MVRFGYRQVQEKDSCAVADSQLVLHARTVTSDHVTGEKVDTGEVGDTEEQVWEGWIVAVCVC